MELGEILQEIQETLDLLIKVMAAGHNQIAEKLDKMVFSSVKEPEYESQRGISIPVDTKPSRE